MGSDQMGDRMKEYEGAEAGRRALPLLPVCIRLDGRSFSQWTRGLGRPYDERLSRLMVETTRQLVDQLRAQVGYTQSDEISLILYSDSRKSEIIFDGKLQKLVSVSASICTAVFNSLVPEHLPERAGRLAIFDSRAWTVPNLDEAANTLVWREIDATKNSVSMATRAHYSSKQMHGKGRAAQMDMLMDKGVNWNNFPAFFKRGTYVQRRKSLRRFTAKEIEALPARHDAHTNPELMVERSDVEVVEMPPILKVTNRVDALLFGADPVPA